MPSDPAVSSPRGAPRLNGRVIFALLLFLGAAYFLVEATQFEGDAREVPVVVGLPTTVLAAASLLQELRRTSEHQDPAGEDRARVGEDGTSLTAAITWLVGLVVLFYLVGWPLTIPVFLVAFLRVYGRQAWPVVAAMTAATWIVLYLLFVELLKIQMYEGIIAG